jgi:hypothetical protein
VTLANELKNTAIFQFVGQIGHRQPFSERVLFKFVPFVFTGMEAKRSRRYPEPADGFHE